MTSHCRVVLALTGASGAAIGLRIAEIFRSTSIQDLCDKAQELGIERKLDARFMSYI